MELPLSVSVVPDLIVLTQSPSTNTELAERAVAGLLAPFTTVVTANQTAGRGRLDRLWTAAPGSALAISVLVASDSYAFVPAAFGWLPLAAGVAMTTAVSSVVPAGRSVGVKWPNDVQIDGRKVCGILSEVLTGAHGVVIGAGVNIAMTEEQLPVPAATSIAVVGGRSDCEDRLLSVYLATFRELVTDYLVGLETNVDALRDRVRRTCTTLGREVRIELPGGEDLRGTAIDIDTSGRLLVRTSDSVIHAVAAGDVTHVR